MNRVTGEDFAVKVLDLRPLQLREKFDQSRLRRWVDVGLVGGWCL